MAGYAITIVEGVVAREPELKHTSGGTAVCNFSIPVDCGWGDNKTTEWYNCTCFGKRAEALHQYVKKGTPLGVTGEMQTQKWEDKNGNKQQRTNLIVNDWRFLTGKRQYQGNDEPDAKAVGGGEPEDSELPF
jgi:single-strand DNA-binding protein